jgi:membrane protein YdbS with pleckstrin-like domain
MPYPKNLLNDDETIAVDLHPHWWYFAEPVGLLVGGVLLAVLSLFVDFLDNSAVRTIALIMVIAAAIWLGVRYVKWISTNFVVTSDRVIFRQGIISKTGIEIPLERVNTVFFRQGIFERMIGTGDLMIESGGEGGQQRFSDIKDPDRVQNTIHKQMDINEERSGLRAARGSGTHLAPGAHHPPIDFTVQLEKLEGMLQRGTLTQEEFDAQKRRLLEG